MTNMWEAATLDYERERLDGFIAAATVAVAEQHGFVIQASSRQEFEDRLALVASAVENTVGRVTYIEPGSFPAVHQAVLASWERDFDIITEQRRVEAQRRNARRAYFRRSEKSAGFKVVDDSSGASTGTVYPNKEIAEQANYGDGYSVQYTEEKVKTAADDAFQRAVRKGLMSGTSYMKPGAMLPSSQYEVNVPGPGGNVPSGLATVDRDEANRWAEALLAAFPDGYPWKNPDYAALGEQAKSIVRSAAVKTAQIEWEDLGLQSVQTYPGLTEKVNLWAAEDMGVTGDIMAFQGKYLWYVHSIDNQEGDALADGSESTLEAAKAMAERAMAEHSTQMSLFASKTAGENPFAEKDDEKADASKKDDTTDSDKDGEQDGPTQPGEQPEPKGDDQQAAPAADQAAPAAPAQDASQQPTQDPTQDPAQPEVAQDKGQAQDPASTADTAQDQTQPADPTTMDVGQSTNMAFTMVEGGSTGSIEVTFVREENGVYFFNGPTGEFGVGQMNGQWQDADGNTFTFGGASAAPQGIGPAQEQAAAADAATPTPDPAANAQQPAPAAPADPNAAPAQDAPPADDAPKSDDSGEKKDDSGDGEKKENPFAKKGD